MDRLTQKICRKFKITTDDVAALAAVGLDTPTKIKAQARAHKKLPAGLSAKLSRWRG